MSVDSRWLLSLLSVISAKVTKLRKLAKHVPEKRPTICMLIDDLTRLALEVEELRETVSSG